MGQRNLGRRPRTAVLSLLLAALCAAPLAQPARAQEVPTAAPEPTPTPAPTPIPAADIPEKAELTVSLLRELTQAAAPIEDITTLEEKFDAEQQKLEQMSQETDALLEEDLTRTELEDIERTWVREADVLDGRMATLRDRAVALDANLGTIRKETDLWRLTGQSADELSLPPALRDAVRSTLKAAAEAEEITSERRDQVLTLQTRITDLKSLISDELVPIREGIESQRRGLLVPEQPPIWRAQTRPPGDQTLAATVRTTLRTAGRSIVTYSKEETQQLVRHGVLFAVLLVLLIVIQRRADRLAVEDESIEATARLLGRPFAAAVLLGALVEDWFHPDAPVAWNSLLAVVLLLALLRLLPRLIPRRLRPALIVLTVTIILSHLNTVLPDTVVLYRALLAFESALSLSCLLWVAHQLDPDGEPASSGWIQAVVRVCRVGALLMAIALVGNVFGTVDLAELLARGTLKSVFTALLLWAGVVIVRGAEAVILRTPTARKLNMVRSYPDRIRAVTGKVLRFVAIAFWVYYTLSTFGLLQPIAEHVSRLFTTKISIGALSFSPFTIIPVLIAIWLTFKASKLIRFLLETDVFSRVTLPRGVPGTISKVTNYIILTIGFFVVAGMLGIDLTKLTIVAGALSVGIGFGLQNIVNNFVSGLILLFERPIKEGDKIEVDTVSGVVEKIGMRASIVKTWQGAEVIVPNADLISGKLVNWTLNDLRRRVDIPIGVAYGTDPETVIRLLLDLAAQHPDVLDDPAPGVPFMNFGDSSLDFELRCWTVEDFVRVGTELRVQITRALAAQGIEIPFPQRDVHVRSTGVNPEARHSSETPSAPVDPRLSVPPSDEGKTGPDVDLGDDGDDDR
jgi:potassium efflux system protein